MSNVFVGKLKDLQFVRLPDCKEWTPVAKVSRNGRTVGVTLTENWAFWRKWTDNSWEVGTFRIFDTFLTEDHLYVDIGAWIGPTVLYAGQIAKATIAFEPDPFAFKELQNNISVNTQNDKISALRAYEMAIAAVSGKIEIGNRQRSGDSTTSALFADAAAHWKVEAVTLNSVIADHGIRGRIFLKIDIEGGEYTLIPSLRDTLIEYDTDLLLSVHPRFLNVSLGSGDCKNRVIAKITRRIRFTWNHARLMMALPYRYKYYTNGRPISALKEIARAFFLGKFTRDLFASNRRWDMSMSRRESE